MQQWQAVKENNEADNKNKRLTLARKSRDNISFLQ